MDTALGLWLMWMATALSFPIAGGLAFALTGPVTSAAKGALAGGLTGLVIGAAQWLVLRPALSSGAWWILASSVGLSLGLALATGVLGLRTDALPLALRGALTGVVVGASQWLFLRQHVAFAGWWIPAVALCWAVGWSITRVAGVDLSKNWPVFGISGATGFAALTGMVLIWLLRHRLP